MLWLSMRTHKPLDKAVSCMLICLYARAYKCRRAAAHKRTYAGQHVRNAVGLGTMPKKHTTFNVDEDIHRRFKIEVITRRRKDMSEVIEELMMRYVLEPAPDANPIRRFEGEERNNG